MIGNKLILLQNGEIVKNEHIPIKVPDLQEFKHLTIKNTRKYGFILLVIILRTTIKTSYFLKKKYNEKKEILKEKIEKMLEGKKHENQEPHDVSLFLKKISDYKKKVNKIKKKIKEEEGIE